MNNDKHTKLLAAIIIQIVAMIITFSSEAATGQIIVKTTNQKTLFFNLDSKPSISFTPTEMTISDCNGEFRFLLADLQSYSFSDEASGINMAAGDKDEVNIALSGRTLISSADDVTILSIDGKIMFSSTQKAGSPVSLQGLIPGVYVVNTGGSSFKIVIK